VHATFNKDYQKANPRLVSELRSTAQHSAFFHSVLCVLQDKVPAELRVKVLNVVTRTGTAKRWLAQWLLLMRHNPPNADSPQTTDFNLYEELRRELIVCGQRLVALRTNKLFSAAP